jgi:hypothetical protein
MEGVVACVAYADGRRVRDVEIPDISEAYEKRIHDLRGA